jgi:hypothetical protein
MDRCKDCYHCEEDEVMENNLAIGVMLGTMFWPEYKTVLKCRNWHSPFHNVEVDNNHWCKEYKK